MKIQKAELAQKINKIKGVVPKKTTMPVLQGILVKDGYLIANNMEMSVKAKIEGIEDECFIIPMKAFDLINNLPNGEVEIIPDGVNITIKAAKIKNKYQTMDPSLFPNAEVPGEGEHEIVLDSKALLESMKRVSYAIPLQAANNTMSSMCLQATGGWLNFVGLDGHVLAWDKIEYDGEFELLIPKSTIDKMLSVGLEGNVSIRHNKVAALFVTDEYEIYTRLVDGDYYKYKNMFGDLSLRTVVTRTEFLDAMVRAKMCTDENSPVKFEISGDTVDITIKDNTTDYHETITLQEALEEQLTIAFNARLVIETLKAFDCDNVGIQLQGPKHPMIVEAEDSDFKSIVLPVQIK
jgi:DNA polymerase III sliding clamp (beta) subunit (PCNA family)